MEKMREILWNAISSEVGVEVAVSDIAAFKRRFYSERAKAREEGNYEFDCLQLISPPSDVTGKLWITKHDPANKTHGEEQGETSTEGNPPV